MPIEAEKESRPSDLPLPECRTSEDRESAVSGNKFLRRSKEPTISSRQVPLSQMYPLGQSLDQRVKGFFHKIIIILSFNGADTITSPYTGGERR